MLKPGAPQQFLAQSQAGIPQITAGQTRASAAPSDTPLMFIQNVGQFDQAARFYLPLLPGSAGDGLWLTDEGLWLTISSQPGERSLLDEQGLGYQAEQTLHLKLTFPGANFSARPEPFIPLDAQISYLYGNDPANWKTGVPVWGGVRYVDFYPGFDLELSGAAGQLGWRLVAHRPEADALTFLRTNIRLQVEGANDLTLAGDHLRLTTPFGERALPLLEVVTAAGTRLTSSLIRPEVKGSEVVAPFIQPPSDPQTPQRGGASTSQTPASLAYSAFLGGSDNDCFLNCVIAVDAGGSAYVAGYTRSADFPATAGVFKRNHQGSNDLFVAKINLDGDRLAYATFIGGSGADLGTAIAVDSAGSAYLTGYTNSADFPTTPNTLQVDYGGGYADAFVVKLNANGSGLDYATFLGGGGNDRGAGIAVDRQGSAFVTGKTQSEDFPGGKDAFEPALHSNGDAFVVKLNPTGRQLGYGTFLGGAGRDDGRAIAIDSLGNAYVTGRTTSADFPVTAAAFATERNGFGDAFVAKVNAAGSDLLYATFLGGSSNDQANGIALDARGNAYLVGSTLSSDFPVTPAAFDQESDGGYDAFVAKVKADGSALTYATYLSGSQGDRGYGIAVDGKGNAYLTGYTYSADFPTTSRAVDAIHAGDLADAFVVKLDAAGSGLVYATFLGAEGTDYGTGIAVDGEGSAYVVGSTQSAEFPAARSAFGSRYSGDWDGFVSKLTVGGEKSTAVISGVVRDRDGFGVPDVVVSAGASGSTSTDSNGVYALIGLKEGIYTLTPIKKGYTFSPARRTVTVPSSEGMQVFTGAPGGDPPDPFLDLPFDYGHSPATFVQALRDSADWGWVTSWFDHAYPDYAKNRNLILWDGHARTKRAFNLTLGCYEGRCYDDHNGIDLAYRAFGNGNSARAGVEIRAAAAGMVVATRSDCRSGNLQCGGGYGNQVILYHDNGYFTLYGHLSRLTVSRRQGAVEAGETLGFMGSTGNSSGPHLHFGLYRDDGNGEWDGEEVDKAVDPFGWRGAEGDPWVIDRQGPISHYLWQYPLSQVEIFVGQEGASIEDATGSVQISVPPAAFSGEVTMELFRGPVAGSPPGFRSVGRAFWLRLLEWLPAETRTGADAISTVSSALDQALTQPITLTAIYTDSEVGHLDVSRLTMARWDEAARSWQNLSTDIDTETRTVTAQTKAMGDFDLQAPLVCPADFVEPDDVYFAARAIELDTPEARLFDIAADEDWFYLAAEAGTSYIIQTLNLVRGVDTVLEVYSLDSQTRLATNNNGRHGLASYLEWQAAQDSSYFIRVSQGANSAHGCQAGYELSVTLKPYTLYLPLVIK